ncbi:oligosaccharide flippase family protein, partial [Myxococcota bacterium]|nr:oligosaccharide flippase family protein [Myxococcota bacterium]
FVRPIAAFFNAPTQVFYIALGVSFVTLYWQFYQAHLMASLQSRTFAFISFLQAFVGLALTVGLILLISSKPYMGKLWAQAIVVGILSIYSLWKLRKLEKRRWHFSHVRYALHIGVPLIPHTLSYFVLASLDRIIINQLKDAGQTGLYALAYNIGSIVMIFVAALNSAWVPLLFKNLNDGNHEKIERTSNYYTMVVVFFALGLTLFSKEVLFIMASPKYHASLHIIPIIVLSSVLIFLYQLCVNYTFYVKKNIWISINTLVCGALNVVLNYRYIPEYGYTAAAYTTLVSYLLLFILNYLTARYYWGTKMLRFRFKLGFLVAVSISYYLLTLALGKVENYAIDFTLRLTLLTLVAGIIYLKAKNIQRQQNTPAN